MLVHRLNSSLASEASICTSTSKREKKRSLAGTVSPPPHLSTRLGPGPVIALPSAALLRKTSTSRSLTPAPAHIIYITSLEPGKSRLRCPVLTLQGRNVAVLKRNGSQHRNCPMLWMDCALLEVVCSVLAGLSDRRSIGPCKVCNHAFCIQSCICQSLGFLLLPALTLT